MRPEVFLSAAAPEFNALRKVVKHALLEIGARPLEHADFLIEYGPLQGVLTQLLTRCSAVIQLVGFQYGQEPGERTLHAPRRSFTRYEIDVARQLELPIYSFVADRESRLQPFGFEDPEAQEFQLRHRESVLRGEAHHASFSTPEELARLVRGLRAKLIVRRSLVRLPGRPMGASFIGRERLLKELQDTLQPGTVHGLQAVQSLQGLGGVGASTLAMEFAWRLHDERKLDFIFWLAAGLRADFEAALAALARTDSLALLPDEVASHRARLGAVLEWFRHPDHAGKFLVIVDGVDSESDWWSLRPFLPVFVAGAVILTGRYASTPGMLMHAVAPFSAEQAREYFFTRLPLPRPGPPAETTAVDRLADMLGRVPLSLALAAGHLAESKLTPRQFLTSLLEGKLLSKTRGNLDLPALFDRSLAALDDATRSLLRQLICLAPEPAAIPLAMFEGRGDWPISSAGLGVLERRQLVQRDESSRTIRIHRTVREMARDRLLDAQHSSDALGAARPALEAALQRAAGGGDQATPGLRELLMPHCRALLGQLNGHPLEIHAALLARGLSDWLNDCGRPGEAEVFARRALSIEERRLGPDAPEVAARLRELAGVLRTLRRLEEAETLYRRALAIDEKNSGMESPEVAADLYHLAVCLRAANRLADAEALSRRALALEETLSGPEHPRVAMALHRLGGLLEAEHRLDEAKSLFERALFIDETAFGGVHPRLTTRLYHLGRVLGELGKYGPAISLFERGLTLDEKTHGPEHPELGPPLAELAVLQERAGPPHAAEATYRRCAGLHERTLGADHVETALARASLGGFLLITGKAAEGATLLEAALHTLARQRGRFRGPHPHFHSVRALYADALRAAGHPKEEREKALAAWEAPAPRRERGRFSDSDVAELTEKVSPGEH